MRQKTIWILTIGFFCGAVLAGGQGADRAVGTPHYRGPIFDVHLHTDPPASATDMPNPVTGSRPMRTREELRGAVLRTCDKHNITHAVLNGWPESLKVWG